MMSKKEGRTMRRNIGKKPWLYPLPVLIIGTYGANGKPDMTRFHPIAFEPAHNGYHVPGERVDDV